MVFYSTTKYKLKQDLTCFYWEKNPGFCPISTVYFSKHFLGSYGKITKGCLFILSNKKITFLIQNITFLRRILTSLLK